MTTKERVRIGDDTSKALIVKGNNGAGVSKKKKKDAIMWLWQPLEVTTSCSLCVCVPDCDRVHKDIFLLKTVAEIPYCSELRLVLSEWEE